MAEGLLNLTLSSYEVSEYGLRDGNRPIDIIDVDANDLSFVTLSFASHPDDVDSSLLQSSLDEMASLADEDATTDLSTALGERSHST